MGRPVRAADLGTVGSLTDDLKMLRSKGGLRAGSVEDIAGSLALMGIQSSDADDGEQLAARELLANALRDVCARVHEHGGEGLRVGAESLEQLMLSDLPQTNQVQDIRATVAGRHRRGPDYVYEYEEQVIALVAREVFQTLRPSGSKPAFLRREPPRVTVDRR